MQFFKNIRAIGIELEGGWYEPPRDSSALKSDGSVCIDGIYGSNREECNCDDCQTGDSNHLASDFGEFYHVGELASLPFTPKALPGYLKLNMPDKVNDTCGLHIHLSFNKIVDYVKLTEERFNTGLRTFLINRASKLQLDTDHQLFKRLNGHNSYCQNDFDPWKQIQDRRDRYTAINFCAFKRHGTVEIRVLPAFSKYNIKEAQKLLMGIVLYTEAYLQSQEDERYLIDEMKMVVEEEELRCAY